MSNLVIIPTYNEKENITDLVKAISSLAVPFDILVIDDNSPDGTARIVKEMMPSFPNLHILERPAKAGLGRAYIAGFEWADQFFAPVTPFRHNEQNILHHESSDK